VTFHSFCKDAKATTGVRSSAGSSTPGFLMSPPIDGRERISQLMYGANFASNRWVP
jgi:hypothetical protein